MASAFRSFMASAFRSFMASALRYETGLVIFFWFCIILRFLLSDLRFPHISLNQGR
jgi:hypothetical protein